LVFKHFKGGLLVFLCTIKILLRKLQLKYWSLPQLSKKEFIAGMAIVHNNLSGGTVANSDVLRKGNFWKELQLKQ
jgi:hypothetical protein